MTEEKLTHLLNTHRLPTSYLDAARVANSFGKSWVNLLAVGDSQKALYSLGRVIAPSDAEATSAAYFPNTPEA